MDPLIRSESIQAGQSLGKFYLVREIGAGGTSRIFKALQLPINRIVALKIPSFSESSGVLSPDEFLSEATLMARLDHPNVVRIHDFGVHEDHAFICMEYVDGWNLADLVAARGALGAAAVLAAGTQILAGLAHAHSRGVLHLDLSPANVLVGRDGTVKLGDFGMAGKRTRTASGRIVGTPAALSPEHVSGAACTALSDLFGFGSLLFFAARGEPLFDPGPGNVYVNEAIRRIGESRSRPPEDRLRLLSAPLASLVRMALQGADAGELSARIRSALAETCGGLSAEALLSRELGLQGDPLAPRAEEDVPEGDRLRALYRKLRDEGRHREAMDLLERALRRNPDDPLLRDLPAEPPSKVKSGAATVEVDPAPEGGFSEDRPTAPEESGTGTSAGGVTPGAGGKGVKMAALAAVAVLLALGAMYLRARGNRTPGEPIPAAVVGADAADRTAPKADPADRGEMGTDPADRAESRPKPAPSIQRVDRAATQTAAAGAAMHSERAVRKPRRRESKPGHPGSPLAPAAAPAVTLDGPGGTRISINDSIEWISPAPDQGWPLEPGLVNLTLSPPGSARPITTSLFASADTLYVLTLHKEGGFSVTRRRR